MERSNQSREGGRGEGAGKQSKVNVVVVDIVTFQWNIFLFLMPSQMFVIKYFPFM